MSERTINITHLPPIVQAAVMSIIRFEEHLDPMGYDMCYYQEDLPKVVERAIAPWRDYCEEV